MSGPKDTIGGLTDHLGVLAHDEKVNQAMRMLVTILDIRIAEKKEDLCNMAANRENFALYYIVDQSRVEAMQQQRGQIIGYLEVAASTQTPD